MFHDKIGYPWFMLEFSFCSAESEWECSNMELVWLGSSLFRHHNEDCGVC